MVLHRCYNRVTMVLQCRQRFIALKRVTDTAIESDGYGVKD
jgi:hypothetical protein